jgi:hypothetical protein
VFTHLTNKKKIIIIRKRKMSIQKVEDLPVATRIRRFMRHYDPFKERLTGAALAAYTTEEQQLHVLKTLIEKYGEEPPLTARELERFNDEWETMSNE